MNNAERLSLIRERLTTALKPQQLEIKDDSQQHVGHPGASTGMGYFSVAIQSPSFEGKSLVQSHQMIYQALGSLMETDIHALQIKIISS